MLENGRFIKYLKVIDFQHVKTYNCDEELHSKTPDPDLKEFLIKSFEFQYYSPKFDSFFDLNTSNGRKIIENL